MAKVSTYTLAAAFDGTEEFYTIQDGVSHRSTGAQMKTFMGIVAPTTVASLPSAIGLQGHRSMVTDATSITLGALAAGGGSNVMPVISDGANWIIG